MKNRMFYIVDVFAEKKFAGNQLAVFRQAAALSDKEMQQIAKEMNYSETTFILDEAERNGGYDVRIFTPAEEVPFAGHPTLGTAFIIQQEILQKPVEAVVLNLKVGQIPVTMSYAQGRPEELWMKQRNPVFGRTFDKADVSRCLNLEAGDIDDRFPVQEVSTGLPFVIVPLKTLSAVRKARLIRESFFALVKDVEAKCPLIFCPQPYVPANDLNARMFGDYFNIPEDPATGSANGCLASYLVKTRYFGESRIDVRVEQGYEIGRPSLLYLKAEKKQNAIDVFVGGKVFLVARGEFV
jgi:trans-2,3-dihydro-3-hydroxyanthranilate isomerase